MSVDSVLCKICGSESLPYAKGTVLKKYDVQYFSCTNCGFIQTEIPFWLNEAYEYPLANSDIGLINRNIKLVNICSALIPLKYNSVSPFLDYGGGSGMFVRMMRDRGFDFYWHDKYATNQFANGFEFIEGIRYSLLTAFEVFEHLPSPLESVENMFKYSDHIIFSTRLLPTWNIRPDSWWYFSLDTGQHVSLYTKNSLALIAKKFNVKFTTNGVSLHILSTKAIPGILLKVLSFPPLAFLMSVLLNLGRKSLQEQDYFRLTGRTLS